MHAASNPSPSRDVASIAKPMHCPAPQSSTSPFASDYIDIEIINDDHPLFCPEYQHLILFNAERGENHFKAVSGRIRPLKSSHRAKLISWLIRVSDKMLFQDETLLLSAALFDRVTALKRIPRHELQLYASTSLWIASKVEEKETPLLSDFVYLCARTYTSAEFLECELQILSLLHFVVASTTSIIYVQAAFEHGGVTAELARFFCLVMMFRPSYGAMTGSMMGTTAIVLACLICGEQVRVMEESVDAIVGCAQQVILALQDVGDKPENPIRHALPRWLMRKGIGYVTEQVIALTKTDAIHSFCSNQ
jgi:hypothetical protein